MKKLSEFNTDEGCDVLIQLCPYITDILVNENFVKDIQNIGDTLLSEDRKLDKIKYCTSLIDKIVPYLLKEKRQAVYGIISIFTEKKIEEISKQSFMVTIEEITKILNDKEFMRFFFSRTHMEGNE